MRLTHLTLIAVLLFNVYSTDANPSPRKATTKIQLADMDADVLYLILYPLEIYELLNFAVAFPWLQPIAFAVFRQKYHNTSLKILVYPTNLHTSIHGNDQKLEIIYEKLEYPKKAMLNRFVNNYCSKSLKDLTIISRNGYPFDEFTTPCTSVEILKCEIYSKYSTNSKPLSEFFPNLRQLVFNIHRDTDNGFIDGAFPHLEHLEMVSGFFSDAEENLKHFEGFIKKNPSIRSVKVGFGEPRMINILNENLPYFENFTLHFHNGAPIQLDNVKNFVYEDASATSISKVIIPRLESLSLCYNENSNGAWMEFFKNHSKLLRLHLKEVISPHYFVEQTIHQVPLKHLTDELVDLVEAEIKSVTISTHDLIQFIREHLNLQRFRFTVSVLIEEEESEFNQFANEWNIERVHLEVNNQVIGLQMTKMTKKAEQE